MKKIITPFIMIIMLIAGSFSVSATDYRITYSLSQISKNSIRVVLTSNINQNIQVTSYSKADDNTVKVTYMVGGELNNSGVTIDLSTLSLNLFNKRYPNILIVEEGNTFVSIVDLPESNEYKNSIMNMYNMNILNGYPDNTFKPDTNITREEFASIFFKLLPKKINNTDDNIFKDIEGDRWSKMYINVLSKVGIIKGKAADKFMPKDNITLAEISTIIDRAYNKISNNSNKTYKHMTKTHWANESVSKLIDDGIINVEDNFYKSYEIDKNITRGECAVILNRLIQSYKDIKLIQ